MSISTAYSIKENRLGNFFKLTLKKNNFYNLKTYFFRYPETVPFRLTHHMIEAMGFLGIEGPFRKCCEVTLKLMQNEKNTLMSYLRPFIYDPMIRNRTKDEMESVDPSAMQNLKTIDKKLKGIVRRYKGSTEIPLSSSGHVSFIIDEATSDQNLSVMFYHWNPYV